MHTRPILRSWLHAVVCGCLGIALADCTGRLEPTTRPTLTPAGAPLAAFDDAGLAQSGAIGPASQPGFYPLRVGNRWVHRLTSTYRLIPSVGNAPPIETFEYAVHRRILAPIALGDRTYLPEEIETVGPGGMWSYVVLNRQDASGLYEYSAIRAAGPVAAAVGGPGEAAPEGPVRTAPRAIERLIASRPAVEHEALAAAASRLDSRIAALGAAVPAGAASAARLRLPGTAGPYELTRLRYPLDQKTGWIVHESFGSPFIAEVIAAERLELPAGEFRGHRIRLRSDFLGPDVTSEIWYGPAGYLMSIGHVEAVATNEGGNIIGLWTYDQREVLLDLHLTGPPIADLPPWYSRPRK